MKNGEAREREFVVWMGMEALAVVIMKGGRVVRY